MATKTLSTGKKNMALLAKDLDITKFVFKKPVVNKHGAPRVDINGPTTFQIPIARAPFGVSHLTYVMRTCIT